MAIAAPTVIVARRVRSGCEQEFADWNRRLVDAVESFPGYLGAEVQAPDDGHPEEWVTIYRFAHQQDLKNWLESNTRKALMVDGELMIDGPTREQRIAQAEDSEHAVTAVMSKHIRPGLEERYRDAHVSITHAMSQFPGFIRSDVAEPVRGVQEDHITVFTFDSRVHLDLWLDSDERQEELNVLDQLVDGPRILNIIGGFGGWFAHRDAQDPVRWKQAVSVLLALYPTTLTLSFLQRLLVPDAPWVPALFVSNVLGIIALTWLLMPAITKRLAVWLRS